MTHISFADFQNVDIRIGTIVEVLDFPKARVPSYKLKLDLGSDLGIKVSSAHLPQNYKAEELLGRQVLCVVNFAPKQIANFISEVLVLGIPDSNGEAILVSPDRPVPNGGRLF